MTTEGITITKYQKDPLREGLWSFQQNGKLCDATLIVNGEKILVHANVLAVSSKYFENLLVESSSKEITFTDIDKDTLLSIIRYIYTGYLDIDINNAENLFKLAKILSIEFVTENSSEISEQALNTSNSILIWKIAKTANFKKIKKAASDLNKKYFVEVSSSRDFLNLEYSDMNEVLDNSFGDESDINMYNAIKNWINHDRPSRHENVNFLLSQVDLSCLPNDLLLNEPSTMCDSLNLCISRFVLSRSLKNRNNATSCQLPKTTLIIIGGNNSEQAKSIEILNIKSHEWIEVSASNITKVDFSALVLGEKILLIGGLVDNEKVNTVDAYNIRTGDLEAFPSMRYAKHRTASVIFNGDIYVIGGVDDTHLSQVEKWNHETNSWSEVSPMSMGRSEHGVKVFKDEIFVIGGLGIVDSQVVLSSVEAYNPSTNKWRSCRSMKRQRTALGVASIGDYIYAIGGWFNNLPLITVERYDPRIDQWTFIESTMVPRHWLGATEFRGEIAVGGGVTTVVETYNLKTREWEHMSTMKKYRAFCHMIEIPCNMAAKFFHREDVA